MTLLMLSTKLLPVSFHIFPAEKKNPASFLSRRSCADSLFWETKLLIMEINGRSPRNNPRSSLSSVCFSVLKTVQSGAVLGVQHNLSGSVRSLSSFCSLATHTHTPLPVLPVKFKTAATPPAVFLRVLPGLQQQPVHAEIKLCPSDWNEMIKVGRSAPVDIAEAPFLLEQYIVTT